MKKKLVEHVAVESLDGGVHCSCGYQSILGGSIGLDVLQYHFEREKELARVIPYVGVGDVVVLSPVLAYENPYSLARVLRIVPRTFSPLLYVEYLDTHSIKKAEEFAEMMRRDNPEYAPMENAIDAAYVTDIVEKGHLGYTPKPYNALADYRRHGTTSPAKNRLQGRPLQMIEEILASCNLLILTGLDEDKAVRLFFKHRPGVLSLNVPFPGNPTDWHGSPLRTGEVLVDRKKFKRWVLRNAMKFSHESS